MTRSRTGLARLGRTQRRPVAGGQGGKVFQEEEDFVARHVRLVLKMKGKEDEIGRDSWNTGGRPRSRNFEKAEEGQIEL